MKQATFMKTKPCLMMGLTLLTRGWNTAATDAIWKDGESNGGDRVPEADADSESSTEAMPAAMNAAAISADEWIQLAPYGEWQDGSPQRWLQSFGPEQAARMARGFNSLVGKIGRLFNGAGIYVGHPDCDPKTYTDHRRLGKIVELEARADGLYGRPSWNALGRENLAEGYHVFPSVVWRFPKPKPGERKVYPEFFQSVGLTNWPAAAEVAPVTRNAQEPEGTPAEESTNNEEHDMKKKELLALLGLEENATPEAVMEAVKGVMGIEDADGEMEGEGEGEMEGSGDLPTEGTEGTEEDGAAENAGASESDGEGDAELVAANAALAAELETARNEIAEMRRGEAVRLIAEAIGAGRISAEDRGRWEADFAADHAAAMNALAAVTETILPMNQSLELGRNKPVVAERNARMTAVNAEVSRRMEKDGLDYDAAWNAVKADPAFAAHFAAMQSGVAE